MPARPLTGGAGKMQGKSGKRDKVGSSNPFSALSMAGSPKREPSPLTELPVKKVESILVEYYDALDHGTLPVMRGIQFSADDLVRRAVIQALMCHFQLSIKSIEIAYLIDFNRYFAEELEQLREYREMGISRVIVGVAMDMWDRTDRIEPLMDEFAEHIRKLDRD